MHSHEYSWVLPACPLYRSGLEQDDIKVFYQYLLSWLFPMHYPQDFQSSLSVVTHSVGQSLGVIRSSASTPNITTETASHTGGWVAKQKTVYWMCYEWKIVLWCLQITPRYIINGVCSVLVSIFGVRYPLLFFLTESLHYKLQWASQSMDRWNSWWCVLSDMEQTI